MEFSELGVNPVVAELGYNNNGYLRTDSLEKLEATEIGARREYASVLTLPEMQKKPGLIARRVSIKSSSLVVQKFTEPAKKAAAKFSSVNYSTTHSLTYMDWIRSYDKRHTGNQLDRWFLTFLIGVVTGLVGVVLNQSLSALGAVKWGRAQDYAGVGDYLPSWGWAFGMGCVYVVIASSLVAFVHPPAAGGGTPEVIAYLNGVVVHGVFGMRNLIVKFISNVFAVSSGMPCAIQGPIICLGAIIGMGIGQFRSRTLRISPDKFSRFRNAVDRRLFTTAGVAAGVAAGFNAPIGGLLFAMEDISSFWSKTLSWHVFFCSVVATATAGLMEAAFNGFKFLGVFGLFTLSLTEPITPHIAMLCASVVLGVVGGLMGAIFTLTNTQLVAVARKKILANFKKPLLLKLMRIFECIIIVFIMSLYYTILPQAFPCQNLGSINTTVASAVADCLGLGGSTTYANYTSPIKLIPYNCDIDNYENATTDYYFSEMATIIQNGGQAQLRVLWSRGTHFFFSWYTPLVLFAVWFPMAIWTVGSCIAGGVFVPVLLTGSFYGRSLGIGMAYLYKYVSGIEIATDPIWRWLDPGLISVMGAAGMLGGVTRLALASTIIVIELCQDINMVIPVMITVLVAKLTADAICKPLFKFQLDGKGLPYLEQDPVIVLEHETVNLELFKACDVMSAPVECIRAVESLYSLAKLLKTTSYHGFPVVKRDKETKLDVCYGMLTRIELYAVLCSNEVFDEIQPNCIINPTVPYEELSEDYIINESSKAERVNSYLKLDHYKMVYVNLDPFINISTPKVEGDFSLQRTYNLFRTLGLRHLVIVDIRNQPIGMITRKDLLPSYMADKLNALPKQASSDTRINVLKQLSVTSINSDKFSNFSGLATVSQKVDAIQEEEEEEEEDGSHTSEESDGIILPAITSSFNVKM